MRKKILFLLFFIFALILSAESKVDELLKSDKEMYKSMTLESNEKSVVKNGYVEKINGQVFLQYEGNEAWIQAVEKSKIKEKTTVITMEKSGVKIKMSDGSFVNIGARTKAYFERMRGEPDKETLNETGIKLFWGKIYSNVKKKVESGAKYEVKTGSVVAGVRGTKYMVSTTKSGEQEITVYEGVVYVRKIDEEIETLLNKNEKIKITKDGKFDSKQEHKESSPEDGIKDESLKEDIIEISQKPIIEENRDISADRIYTGEMINKVVEDTNTAQKTTLNIYIK